MARASRHCSRVSTMGGNSVNKYLGNSFLIMFTVIGLALTYVTIKAKQVADDWQKTNDRAVAAMEENLK